jgi:hypothetical protein
MPSRFLVNIMRATGGGIILLAIPFTMYLAPLCMLYLFILGLGLYMLIALGGSLLSVLLLATYKRAFFSLVSRQFVYDASIHSALYSINSKFVWDHWVALMLASFWGFGSTVLVGNSLFAHNIVIEKLAQNASSLETEPSFFGDDNFRQRHARKGKQTTQKCPFVEKEMRSPRGQRLRRLEQQFPDEIMSVECSFKQSSIWMWCAFAAMVPVLLSDLYTKPLKNNYFGKYEEVLTALFAESLGNIHFALPSLDFDFKFNMVTPSFGVVLAMEYASKISLQVLSRVCFKCSMYAHTGSLASLTDATWSCLNRENVPVPAECINHKLLRDVVAAPEKSCKQALLQTQQMPGCMLCKDAVQVYADAANTQALLMQQAGSLQSPLGLDGAAAIIAFTQEWFAWEQVVGKDAGPIVLSHDCEAEQASSCCHLQVCTMCQCPLGSAYYTCIVCQGTGGAANTYCCSQKCFKDAWPNHKWPSESIGKMHDCNFSAYYVMNNMLRRPVDAPVGDFASFAPYTKLLLQALGALQPRSGCKVYRALGRLSLEVFQVYAAFLEGDTIIWNNFSSTSLNQKAAENFLAGPLQVFCSIDSDYMFDIQAFSAFPAEEELLLPMCSAFEVLSIELVENDDSTPPEKRLNISMRHLPPDPHLCSCLNLHPQSSTVERASSTKLAPEGSIAETVGTWFFKGIATDMVAMIIIEGMGIEIQHYGSDKDCAVIRGLRAATFRENCLFAMLIGPFVWIVATIAIVVGRRAGFGDGALAAVIAVAALLYLGLLGRSIRLNSKLEDALCAPLDTAEMISALETL